MLFNLGLMNISLDWCPQARATKTKIKETTSKLKAFAW